jgi:hypothetical protein
MRLNDTRRTLVCLGFVLGTGVQPVSASLSLAAALSDARQPQDVHLISDSSPPSLHQPPIVDAIVDRYLLHPLGDVEGLLLSDGLQMHVTLRAAQELVTIIQPGDRVRVHGRRHAQLPIVQPDVIINVTDGRSLTVPFRLDYPIPPSERRQTLRAMTASGSIQVLLYDYLKPVVNGALLSDGTQVRLPPDVGERFRSSLQPHLDVEVEGYGTETQYGRSLEATAIGRKGSPLTHLDASVQQLR